VKLSKISDQLIQPTTVIINVRCIDRTTMLDW